MRWTTTLVGLQAKLWGVAGGERKSCHSECAQRAVEMDWQAPCEVQQRQMQSLTPKTDSWLEKEWHCWKRLGQAKHRSAMHPCSNEEDAMLVQAKQAGLGKWVFPCTWHSWGGIWSSRPNFGLSRKTDIDKLKRSIPLYTENTSQISTEQWKNIGIIDLKGFQVPDLINNYDA